MNAMANHYDHPDNAGPAAATGTAIMKWESRGLMIDVCKNLDTNSPLIKIDLASTLGASSNFPLAVKKAVRYWFMPELKTKTEVVQYINSMCRRNGFKISTLSNSKQGLDRRAQLVCSRGIVARKPRGKSESVQTTTTRPITLQEKCPFSLTVYECHKSGRWYLRKFGNGSRMHCGHCQLQPDQVGVRRYQNLTERIGTEWSEAATSLSPDEWGMHEEIDVRACVRAIDEESSEKDPSSDSPKNKKTLMNPRTRLSANNPIEKKGNQQEILGYFAGLRDRIIYNDYNDRLLMERARLFQGIESEINEFGRSVQPYRYQNANNNFQNGTRNGPHEMLSNPIGALSQKHLANNRYGGSPNTFNAVAKYSNEQLIEMLSNQVGLRTLSSFLKKNEIQQQHDDESICGLKVPNRLERRAESDFRSIDSNTKSINTPNLSTHEDETKRDRNNNINRKRMRADDDLCRTPNVHPEKVVSDEKIGADNSTPIHDHFRSESLSASDTKNIELGQKGSIRSKINIVSNEITKHRNVTDDQCMPETVGSNAGKVSDRTNEGENKLEGHIKIRKGIQNENDNSQKPTGMTDFSSDPYADVTCETFGAEYAMLRPMAVYDYPSTSETYDGAEL